MTGEMQPKPPRRSRIWILPAMVFGLMALQISLCAAGIYAATSSRSFAVEQDYYSKAIHWDQEQAALKASAALGWTVIMEVGPVDGAGQRGVVLTVRDRTGTPIHGAKVEIISFHHARAKDIFKGELPELESGRYGAPLPLARTGNWEFRTRIDRGGEKYLHREVRELH